MLAERPVQVTNRRPLNVDLDFDARYWIEEFRVSAAQLDSAVLAVGPLAEDVRRYLHGNATSIKSA
jgi:hypothetical protein